MRRGIDEFGIHITKVEKERMENLKEDEWK
jgi:hypothetical protein